MIFLQGLANGAWLLLECVQYLTEHTLLKICQISFETPKKMALGVKKNSKFVIGRKLSRKKFLIFMKVS